MFRLVPLAFLVLISVGQSKAGFIDFESLSSLESVTNHFPGLTFTNTIVLTAGTSLNEADFPPRSGVNVVSDDGGPMTIVFSTPALSVFGYFTYVSPLSLEAFDLTDTSIALSSSLFSANDGFTGALGSTPNELIGISDPFGRIARVVITGDPFGSSFVLDDLSYTNAVPEPASGLLSGTAGLVFSWLWMRRQRRR